MILIKLSRKTSLVLQYNWYSPPGISRVADRNTMRYFCLLLTVFPLSGAVQLLTPAWVEVGPDSKVLARVVIAESSECPAMKIDGASPVRMQVRAPVPKNFQPVCEFEIPAGAKRAMAGVQNLVLPSDNPAKVAVIGDTGCRLKGDRIQACNDPDVWPFAQVAATTASQRPQLVIHVGDYLYRETPCPPNGKSECGGSPNGDNWDTWSADFFTPASPLLAAAPWAFSRGNHESCARAWRGWFYYLDPRPFPEACPDFSEPWLARLGTFQLLMVDTSAANDAKVDPRQLARYTDLLKPFASTNAWLVVHHPLWGLKREKDDKGDVPLTAVLAQAYNAAAMSNIGLVLAGHTHLFEILSFSNGLPPQIVAGDAGTTLAGKIGKDLKGETVFGTQVASGTSRHEFGVTMLERKQKRWNVALRNPANKTLASCKIDGRTVRCQGAK